MPSPYLSATPPSWTTTFTIAPPELTLTGALNNVLAVEEVSEEQVVSIAKYNKLVKTFYRNHVKAGDIGLEIECEGEKLFGAPLRWWVCHSDGSLRATNGHPPVEYVLREPVSRQDLTKALGYLSKHLKASESKVVDSPRASVHVHLNCQTMTIKQVITMVLLYFVVEELLVEFSGEDRIGNMFCLRAKDAGYFLYTLENSIRQNNFSSDFSNEHLRYTSCNIASLSKFGSVEFRSMRGTVDPKLIELWVDILLSIKNQSLTLDNPQQICEKFNTLNPQGMLEFIFPDPNHLKWFKDHPNLHNIIWDGIRRIRDIAYCIPEWERYVPSKRVSRAKLKVDTTRRYTLVEAQNINLPAGYIWGTEGFGSGVRYFIVKTSDDDEENELDGNF